MAGRRPRGESQGLAEPDRGSRSRPPTRRGWPYRPAPAPARRAPPQAGAHRGRSGRCRTRSAPPGGGPALATAAAATTPGQGPARRERGAQIVDLEVGLLDALLIISARRGVEQGRQRRVVVTVTCTYGVGFSRLAKFFQRVLTHGFQQPVAGSASAIA